MMPVRRLAAAAERTWALLHQVWGTPGWIAIVAGVATSAGFVFWLPQEQALVAQEREALAARRSLASLPVVHAELRSAPAPDVGLASVADIGPAIVEIQRLARMLNIELLSAQYTLQDRTDSTPPAFEISLPIKAKWPMVRPFIVMCLNTMPALALREFSVRRPSVDETVVDIQLRFALLLRESRP